MSKDLDLVDKAAKASGAELPAAKITRSIYTSVLSSSGELDMSAITPFVGHYLDSRK
jgi:3-hydroxyisobutyrate dehydrogenase-like beta-hydroxyacid dehydrogenase